MSVRKIQAMLAEVNKEKQSSIIVDLRDCLKCFSKILDEYVEFKRTETSNDTKQLFQLIKVSEQIYSDALLLTWQRSGMSHGDGQEFVAERALQRQNYSVSGTAEEGFVLLLPLLPKRLVNENKQSQYKTTKVIAQNLRQDIISFLQEHGIAGPVYKNAHVEFTLCIGDDMRHSEIPDADSIDTKYVLDALNGTLIQNDSLLSLSLAVKGQIIEGDSYTKVNIKDTSKITI